MEHYVLLKFCQGIGVCLLNPRAISLRACDLGVGAVVVAQTVCCSGVLAEELELVEDAGRDSCSS